MDNFFLPFAALVAPGKVFPWFPISLKLKNSIQAAIQAPYSFATQLLKSDCGNTSPRC
jgi:hypothetical protein